METASEIVQNHDAYLNLRRSNLKITLIDLNSFKSTKEKEKRSTRYQKWIKSNEIRFSSKYSISIVQRRNRETIFDSSVGSTSLLFEQRLYQEPTKRSRSWLAGRWLFCLWEAGCAVWFCWLSNRSSGSRSRALCYVTRTAGISLPSPASRHDDARAKDWILRLPAFSSRGLESQWRVGRTDVKFCSFPLFIVASSLLSSTEIFKVYLHGEIYCSVTLYFSYLWKGQLWLSWLLFHLFVYFSNCRVRKTREKLSDALLNLTWY